MASTKESSKSKSADSAQGERPETGFKDISAAVEQAKEDEQRPALDPETGEPNPQVSEAAVEIAQEQAYRAAAQVEGGGPWPPELLREKATAVGWMQPRPEQYTSHEDPDEQ